VRLRQMFGCPVVNASTGDRLGRVDTVLIDLNGRRIAGFRLRHGGLLDRRWRLASMDDVTEVRDDAVLVADSLALREDEPAGEYLPLNRHRSAVLAADGSVIGTLADVEADPTTGELLALLITPRARRLARPRPPLSMPMARVQRHSRGLMLVDDEASRMLRRRCREEGARCDDCRTTC
jgi:sporulation protein YlmC with PRC-barrel domain